MSESNNEMIHFQTPGRTEAVFHWVIGVGVGGFAIIYDPTLVTDLRAGLA